MRTFLFIASFLCCLTFARAESLVLGENFAASQIAQGFNLFRTIHGKEPATWAEIESVFGKPLNQIHKNIQPTTRYGFLETPLILPNSKDRIVILSRSPFYDEYKMRGFFGPIVGNLPSALKRYAIVVSPNGEASRIPFSEPQIQKLFSDAGVALPTPDELGSRPYESVNRFALWFWVGTAFVVCGFAGKFLILPFLKKAITWQPT